jgi:hypothetical protein
MREAKEIVSQLKEDIQAMVEGERANSPGKISELQNRLHQYGRICRYRTSSTEPAWMRRLLK